jgi:hypothetical protein
MATFAVLLTPQLAAGALSLGSLAPVALAPFTLSRDRWLEALSFT